MRRAIRLALALIVPGLVAGQVAADSVHLRGSSIVLTNCRVLSIKGGEVDFIGPGGRRMRQHAEDVVSITFEGIGETEHAETAMLEEDYAKAVKWFVLALDKAENDIERQWIHARLARAHDALGQYVQAAGHAAAVFALDDQPVWKRLAPVSTPDRPAYPAAIEAYEQLRAAARTVKSRELVRLIEEMTIAVKAACDEASQHWTGGRIAPGSTISGFARSDLDVLRASLEAGSPPATEEETAYAISDNPPTPPPPPPPQEGRPSAPASESSADTTPAVESPSSPPPTLEQSSDEDPEAMVRRGRYRPALAACEAKLASASGDEAARLEYVSGLALNGLERPRDAAVAFTRAAVLHPSSPVAAACLLETGLIYRTTYGRPSTASRLLEMALKRAAAGHDDMIASRARSALEDLHGRPSP